MFYNLCEGNCIQLNSNIVSNYYYVNFSEQQSTFKAQNSPF